ncbi:hypothetical protein [Streptomyces shenzhenensis]|uniref:Uncharacterized protein n=1 Tax=Streptomyces shenzhenensis TaxID=943815 RepID=A0A3M0IEW0_9ACTN|nr:hypothetical protein [Streptomyces shenzhenensis]RMB87345.1 hypothetical protein CTZ28_05390 [Streptomyces shenzhenensis]
MDRIGVPHRTFEHLLSGFIRSEAEEIAHFGRDAEVVIPGEPFGNVFAWLWEEDRDAAVGALSGLLAEARRVGQLGDEIRLESLIKGLRSALQRSRLGQEQDFREVERTLREQVPEHFGGRTDL